MGGELVNPPSVSALTGSSSALALAPDVPVAALNVGLSPAASSSAVLVAGAQLSRGRGVYSRLSGLAWYAVTGFHLRNRGRKGRRRSARGVDDGNARSV
jgi:hypothetical protein